MKIITHSIANIFGITSVDLLKNQMQKISKKSLFSNCVIMNVENYSIDFLNNSLDVILNAKIVDNKIIINSSKLTVPHIEFGMWRNKLDGADGKFKQVQIVVKGKGIGIVEFDKNKYRTKARSKIKGFSFDIDDIKKYSFITSDYAVNKLNSHTISIEYNDDIEIINLFALLLAIENVDINS